jgi:hypothetical protein
LFFFLVFVVFCFLVLLQQNGLHQQASSVHEMDLRFAYHYNSLSQYNSIVFWVEGCDSCQHQIYLSFPLRHCNSRALTKWLSRAARAVSSCRLGSHGPGPAPVQAPLSRTLIMIDRGSAGSPALRSRLAADSGGLTRRNFFSEPAAGPEAPGRALQLIHRGPGRDSPAQDSDRLGESESRSRSGDSASRPGPAPIQPETPGPAGAGGNQATF